MKRVLLALLVGILLLCPIVPVSAANQKIVVLSWYTDEPGGFLAELKQAFEKDNPGYELEYITVSSSQVYDRLQTMIAAGEPPDISLLGFDWLAALAESKMIQDVDDYVRNNYPLHELFPPIQQAMQWKGKYYALPQRITAKVMYYNRQQFREAGLGTPSDNWTWKDFLSLAQKLTIRDAEEITRYGFMMDFVLDGHYHWFPSNSADWFTDDRTQLTMTDPRTIEVMQFLQDLIYAHRVTATPAVRNSLTSAGTAYFNGRTAMQVGGSGTPAPNQYPGFEWALAPIPANTEPGGRVWANLWVIPTGVRDIELSLMALGYFAGPVGQQIAFDTRVGLPALRSQALTAKYDHDYRDYLLGAFSVGKPYPVIANRDVWSVFNAEFSKLWNNAAPARTIAEAIQQQAEPLMPK
ncbi:MAG TPA: sugar ABC transporter substrate-binding protein [Firmicutes bacterium]|jgi:multiple sugar transport system substrate-binding protein|nr:sugar ABC transporter substrate-binding protein [Bacillota bacterium]